MSPSQGPVNALEPHPVIGAPGGGGVRFSSGCVMGEGARVHEPPPKGKVNSSAAKAEAAASGQGAGRRYSRWGGGFTRLAGPGRQAGEREKRRSWLASARSRQPPGNPGTLVRHPPPRPLGQCVTGLRSRCADWGPQAQLAAAGPRGNSDQGEPEDAIAKNSPGPPRNLRFF